MGAYLSYNKSIENDTVDDINNTTSDAKIERDFTRLEMYLCEILGDDYTANDNIDNNDDTYNMDNTNDTAYDSDSEISLPSIDYDFESERKVELHIKQCKNDTKTNNRIRNLFIKYNGKTMVFYNITADKYIRNVKNLVSNKIRIPIGNFNFKYQGKHLEDYKTLRFYNVTSDSTLDMNIA
jgi:hypothetical protein